MTAVELVLNQPVAAAIGWALVHFVWQGALVAAVTALLLGVLRRSAADIRYVVATIGLVLMATMPVVTVVQSWPAASTVGARGGDAVFRSSATNDVTRDVNSAASVAPAPATDVIPAALTLGSVYPAWSIEPWMPTLLLVWLSGVALLTLRLASGWLWVQRMKTRNAAPARAEWVSMASRLARRLHISRSIQLLESTIVDVPTVIGSVRPLILLPASALSGLSTLQLEAILAHELAHIRRHDYLVNLLQAVVETLLFYHPAVWWLSRRIRIERENCCDDLAVSLCGDPYTYASALADLEELRGGALVIAANGGSLLQRVRRLLGAPSHEGRSPGWLAGGIAVLVMVAMAAGAVGSEVLRVGTAAAQVPASAPDVPEERAPTRATAAPAPRAATGNLPPPSMAAPPAMAASGSPATPAIDSMVPAAAAAPIATPAASAPPAYVPVPLGPVAVAAPPAASQNAVRIEDSHRRPRGNFSWSDDRQRIDVSYEGVIEFTDDDSDVRSISPGGFLKLSDGGWFGGRGVEFRADASGNITRRYRVGIVEKPFEPEGRAWLSQNLPRFIRQSAIGAQARVTRIMKARGPAGVLDEISRIEGSYGKRIYFTELLKTPSLDGAIVRQVLSHAGREISGDYELATLLISSRHLLLDDATRKVYFDAAQSIQGDYELRRVLSAGLKTGPLSSPMLVSILAAATSIDGDYELASLLVEIAKQQPLDAASSRAFFTALQGVNGSHDRGRVLAALSARSDLTTDMVAAMLRSVTGTRSDYDTGQFLIRLAKARPIDTAIRAPFFAAVDSINSSYDRGRVLETVAKRPDTPPDTIVSVIRSAGAMSGNYEKAQVLLAVAASHPIAGTARDAYIAAANNLGEYEQGRVLAALVRNERGNR